MSLNCCIQGFAQIGVIPFCGSWQQESQFFTKETYLTGGTLGEDLRVSGKNVEAPHKNILQSVCYHDFWQS